jgi:LCP family protein required for cell wall assembly
VPAKRDKLNAAYSLGGPQLAVATIEKNTGIRVDHYVEVNFAGFEQIVNAVGGVEVCTNKPLVDKRAGLRLKAGRSTLDGATALAYVRARYLDGRGDIGRIERQQKFLGSVAAKAMSSDVLLNPRRLASLVDAARKATTTDPGLGRSEILTLADKLRNMSPKAMQFLTVPMADLDHDVDGVGSTVLWDEAPAKAMFESIRADQPAAAPVKVAPKVTVAPERIRVAVRNGSGMKGLGARAVKELSDAGYAVSGKATNAASADPAVTTVRYDDDYSESVKTLQAALPGATFVPVPRLGGTFEVTLGSSYDGVRPVKVSAPGPVVTAAPARTAADNVCA